MKRLALSIVLACACSTQLTSDEGTFTAELLNGRGWKQLNADAKTAYVAGLHEALAYASKSCGGTPLAESYPRFARSQETVDAVNRFYAEPANAALPVLYALRLFRMRVDGMADSEIQAKLEEFRRLIQNANKAVPK